MKISIDGDKKYRPELILDNNEFLYLISVIESKIVKIGNAQKPYD